MIHVRTADQLSLLRPRSQDCIRRAVTLKTCSGIIGFLRIHPL
jgi:hypothetical protein